LLSRRQNTADITLGKSAAVRMVRVVSVPIVITSGNHARQSAAVRQVRVVSVPIVITSGNHARQSAAVRKVRVVSVPIVITSGKSRRENPRVISVPPLPARCFKCPTARLRATAKKRIFVQNLQVMMIEIPDTAIQETPLSPAELRLELAIWLYTSKRLTLGQARKLAGFSIINFQKALAERGLYLNFDKEDLTNDIAAAHTIS